MATEQDNDVSKDNDLAPRGDQEVEVDTKTEQISARSSQTPEDENSTSESAKHKEMEKERLLQDYSNTDVEETGTCTIILYAYTSIH